MTEKDKKLLKKKKIEELLEKLSKEEKSQEEDNVEEKFQERNSPNSSNNEHIDAGKIILKSSERASKIEIPSERNLEEKISDISVPQNKQEDDKKYANNEEFYKQISERYDSQHSQQSRQINVGRETMPVNTLHESNQGTTHFRRLVPTEMQNAERSSANSGRELAEYNPSSENKHKTHLDKISDDIKYR